MLPKAKDNHAKKEGVRAWRWQATKGRERDGRKKVYLGEMEIDKESRGERKEEKDGDNVMLWVTTCRLVDGMK